MHQRKSVHGTAEILHGSLCAAIGSPYSTLVANAIGTQGLTGLKGLDIDPSEYSCSRTFALDYCAFTYLKKFRDSADVKRLTAEALASFKETELRVHQTNLNLKRGARKGVEGIISDARRKISSILGRMNLDEFARSCGWGKGATSSLTADVATLDKKILEPRLSVTTRCLAYAEKYLAYDSTWMSARLGTPCGSVTPLRSEFFLTECGRLTTADKDWKTRRTIDIQPTLNLFFQKGMGKMIRRRLKRCGVDLDDQSRNQKLASQAHKAELATIDLAKASDSISTELVRLLMPPEWFQVLWDLRTHRVSVDGEDMYLQKFSAMGNGYTFELESLIFFALCWATIRCEGSDYDSEIAVYGDDIVVHQHHSSRVIEVLSECGFETNVDKTFTSGSFFESCGRHYFNGVDVTPIFQKEAIRCLPSAIRAANRIFRWALRLGVGVYLDNIIKGTFDQAVSVCSDQLAGWDLRKRRKSKVAKNAIPLIPWYSTDDGGLLTNDLTPFETDINGIARTKVLYFQPRKVRAEEYALFAQTLRTSVVCDSPFGGFVTPRDQGSYQLVTRRMYVRRGWVPAWA